MQLKGPPGVKRLFVIITDNSHRLKACRAPTTHKLLDFTLKSIPFSDYFLCQETHDLQEQTSAQMFVRAQICRWSVCMCICPCLCLFYWVFFFFWKQCQQTSKMLTTKLAKGVTEPTGLLGPNSRSVCSCCFLVPHNKKTRNKRVRGGEKEKMRRRGT